MGVGGGVYTQTKSNTKRTDLDLEHRDAVPQRGRGRLVNLPLRACLLFVRWFWVLVVLAVGISKGGDYFDGFYLMVWLDGRLKIRTHASTPYVRTPDAVLEDVEGRVREPAQDDDVQGRDPWPVNAHAALCVGVSFC